MSNRGNADVQRFYAREQTRAQIRDENSKEVGRWRRRDIEREIEAHQLRQERDSLRDEINSQAPPCNYPPPPTLPSQTYPIPPGSNRYVTPTPVTFVPGGSQTCTQQPTVTKTSSAGQNRSEPPPPPDEPPNPNPGS